MPPLPPIWDPAGAVDKLPQPFRMIDKVLAEVVEQVLDVIGKREQRRKQEEASRIDLVRSSAWGRGRGRVVCAGGLCVCLRCGSWYVRCGHAVLATSGVCVCVGGGCSVCVCACMRTCACMHTWHGADALHQIGTSHTQHAHEPWRTPAHGDFPTPAGVQIGTMMHHILHIKCDLPRTHT